MLINVPPAAVAFSCFHDNEMLNVLEIYYGLNFLFQLLCDEWKVITRKNLIKIAENNLLVMNLHWTEIKQYRGKTYMRNKLLLSFQRHKSIQ